MNSQVVEYHNKIAIYNEKGRLGKTPFALEIALRLGYNYATNQNRPREDISQLFEDDQFLQVGPKDEFPLLDDDFEVVFDLAGELVGYEDSIISALNQADIILVPVINDGDAINATAYAVQEIKTIKGIDEKLFFLGTNLRAKNDFQDIKDGLFPQLGKTYPILPFQHSKAFNWTKKEGQSISKVVEHKRHALQRYAFKKILSQLDELFKNLRK